MAPELPKEFICKKDNIKYAGTHLIIEIWDAKNIASIKKIDNIFRKAITACRANLLEMKLH